MIEYIKSREIYKGPLVACVNISTHKILTLIQKGKKKVGKISSRSTFLGLISRTKKKFRNLNFMMYISQINLLLVKQISVSRRNQ